MSDAIEIDLLSSPREFSVCTLVTDPDEYQVMKDSFVAAGFDDAQFIYADNSNGNKYDGYQAVNLFLDRAEAKYIIICHQDIELRFDDITVLRERIDALESKDEAWAIAGNAGYSNLAQPAMCISDPYGSHRQKGVLPQKVRSLDENFIIIKKSANLCVSHDLQGFHFYATDLCQVAHIVGRSSYVIDFHLYHKSAGTIDKRFETAKDAFVEKYTHALKPTFLRTTCDKLFISGSSVLNTLCNSKFCYRLVKLWQKI